jgi:glycosyltransferase involved in cell wall biosynthesis
VIAGDRSWDREELGHALGADVPSWIWPSGYVTDRQLAGFYRHAAVCVVPSLHEGFGLPVLEAMACGTPVACSRIPVFEEVAGDTATYFDPLVIEEMAASVASLLNDRTQAHDLAARACARAETFTWEETARKTIAVYRRALLDEPPASAETRAPQHAADRSTSSSR